MRFPGKTLFSPPKPPAIPPPIPVVQPTDPSIAAAAKKQELADAEKRGRAALILAKDSGGTFGVTNAATAGGARHSQLLGG